MELPSDPNQVGPVCLVTGGNGYVGKHLVRRLLELGCEVRALDLAPFQGDARVTSIVGDVRQMNDMEAACEGVDTVFHAAAIINTLTLARPSVRQQVYGVNVQGTECVIEACRATGVKKLIFTSSITVAVDRPIREGDETAPTSAPTVFPTYTRKPRVEPRSSCSKPTIPTACVLPQFAQAAFGGQGRAR